MQGAGLSHLATFVMTPILYSYRRCPYAMRARMALHYADIEVEIREISLKDKPVHMLQASPKGTVPVLVLTDGTVIDQSLEIMDWALSHRDTDGWLVADSKQVQQLIAENDGGFKQSLDKYKYAIRFPEHPVQYYRSEAAVFLAKLELRLAQTKFLFGDKISLADIAIFPFIRQFAAVDSDWFESTQYSGLKSWLHYFAESELLQNVMQKHPVYLG